MNRLEENALRALIGCSFPKKMWHAKFVRRVWQTYLDAPHQALTASEERQLWRLVHRYRRQIQDRAVLREAEIRHAAAAGAPLLDFGNRAIESSGHRAIAREAKA